MGPFCFALSAYISPVVSVLSWEFSDAMFLVSCLSMALLSGLKSMITSSYLRCWRFRGHMVLSSCNGGQRETLFLRVSFGTVTSNCKPLELKRRCLRCCDILESVGALRQKFLLAPDIISRFSISRKVKEVTTIETVYFPSWNYSYISLLRDQIDQTCRSLQASRIAL